MSDFTIEEYNLITQIAKRVVDENPGQIPLIAIELDLCTAHSTHRLRLQEFLGAPDYDFYHDINGIIRNLDRVTGEYRNFFSPRFSEV